MHLVNLPELMSSYEFDDNLVLKCINDGKKCFVIADTNNTIDEINNLFSEKPIVYTYDTSLDTIEFEDYEPKHLNRYEVCFEYKINKYKKAKDIIVEYKDKVYVFNSFNNKATILDYLSDVSLYFDDNINKVKNAF